MHTGGSEEKEEDICRNVQTDVGTDTKPQPIHSKLNRGILFFIDLHSGCAFPLVFHLNGDACEHAQPMYIQWMDPWPTRQTVQILSSYITLYHMHHALYYVNGIWAYTESSYHGSIQTNSGVTKSKSYF